MGIGIHQLDTVKGNLHDFGNHFLDGMALGASCFSDTHFHGHASKGMELYKSLRRVFPDIRIAVHPYAHADGTLSVFTDPGGNLPSLPFILPSKFGS